MTSILGHLEWVYEWVSLESRCVNISYLVDISPYSNSLIYSHEFRQVPAYLFKNISPRTTLSIGTAFQPLWWMITALYLPKQAFQKSVLNDLSETLLVKTPLRKGLPKIQGTGTTSLILSSPLLNCWTTA